MSSTLKVQLLLTISPTHILAQATNLSILDHCNSLLTDIPDSVLAPCPHKQHVLSTAARMIHFITKFTLCNFPTSSSLASHDCPLTPITQSPLSWVQSYSHFMTLPLTLPSLSNLLSQHIPMVYGSLHHLSRSLLKCVLFREALPNAPMHTSMPCASVFLTLAFSVFMAFVTT